MLRFHSLHAVVSKCTQVNFRYERDEVFCSLTDSEYAVWDDFPVSQHLVIHICEYNCLFSMIDYICIYFTDQKSKIHRNSAYVS
jgi:hypothetical protein